MTSSKRKTKGQRSKEKIIEVTLDLIFKKGYSETSAQEIADICGISQTTVFYHFKSKQNLFIEILEYVIQNNRDLFQEIEGLSKTPYERLRSLLISNIKWSLNYPEQTNMLLLLFNFATYDDELKEIADKMIERGQEMVFDILNQMEDDFNICRKVLSKIIQQYANGVMFQILASQSPQLVAENFQKGLDYYLAGLLQKTFKRETYT